MNKKHRVRTYETLEPVKFSVDNPTGFGPDKVKVKIPKGVKLKVKEK